MGLVGRGSGSAEPGMARSPAYRNPSDSSTARAPSVPPGRRSRRIVRQRPFRDAAAVGIRSGLRGEASRRTRGLRRQTRTAQVRNRCLQRLCDPPEIDGRAPGTSLFQALQCGEPDAAGARQVGKTDAQAFALCLHELRDDAVDDKGWVVRSAGQRPTPRDSGRRARRMVRGGGRLLTGRSRRRRRHRASPPLPSRDAPSPLRS